MPSPRHALALALGVGLLLLARSSSGRAVHIDEVTGLPDVEPADANDPDAFVDPPELDAYDPSTVNASVYYSEEPMNNLDAALYMVRRAEHLESDVRAGLEYGTFYGGSRFSDFSDHPVITGEKVGVKLPPEWCRRLGYKDGNCVSTAAGAYQITKPTWLEFRSWGGPTLPDFSPESQDELARRIMRKIGAADAFMEGDFANGLRIASKRWASLPGSTAGQHVRTMDFVVGAYNEGLASGMA